MLRTLTVAALLHLLAGCAASGGLQEKPWFACALGGGLAGGGLAKVEGEDFGIGAVIGAAVGAALCSSQGLAAADADGDGVPDKYDRCAATGAGLEVDALGCTADRDGDGVPDSEDDCLGTLPGAQVDAGGCAIAVDRDRDGVVDAVDRCPGTPSGTVVDAAGCGADLDGDGVAGELDRCPATPPGIAVDARGCAPPPPRTLVLEGVAFASGSAELGAGARQPLARLARSLLDNPTVRVEIGGHTDGRGDPEANRRLSRRRAEAVRDFLVAAGVAPSRVIADGYGASRPLADDASAEGRARNRRVEVLRLDQPG